MKAKDLIKILQAVDPDTRVQATVERNDNTRFNVARICMNNGNGSILEQMEIDGVDIEIGLQGEEDNTLSCILLLQVDL